MKLYRRDALLLFALSVCIAAWLGLLAFDYMLSDGPNYTLIEEGLYLGGVTPKPPPRTTAVLNLCENDDPFAVEHHLWEPIRDAPPAPDLAWLTRVVDFIADNRRSGRTTYVHCRNGVSRGGMVVTAYLMREHGWTRDEALERVQTRRPIVRPHPVFMERLSEWERELVAKRPGK